MPVDDLTSDPGPTSLLVRAARADEAPIAAALLADAFADYPWTRWTVAADGHLERLAALQELYLTSAALPFGRVDLGLVHGTPTTVAVWLRPAAVPEEVWADLAPAAVDLAGDRAAAGLLAEAVLGPHRPTEDHVVLASLGVARAAQGRGLGTAASACGLARADRKGLPVTLETSEQRNVRFYQRLGFTTTAVVDLPDGGPRTWLMRRPPGAPLVREGRLSARRASPAGASHRPRPRRRPR